MFDYKQVSTYIGIGIKINFVTKLFIGYYYGIYLVKYYVNVFIYMFINISY